MHKLRNLCITANIRYSETNDISYRSKYFFKRHCIYLYILAVKGEKLRSSRFAFTKTRVITRTRKYGIYTMTDFYRSANALYPILY